MKVKPNNPSKLRHPFDINLICFLCGKNEECEYACYDGECEDFVKYSKYKKENNNETNM